MGEEGGRKGSRNTYLLAKGENRNSRPQTAKEGGGSGGGGGGGRERGGFGAV